MGTRQYFVGYDIASQRRRKRVATVLEGHGHRLHESAFVCTLREAQWAALQRRLLRLLDPVEDKLHLYPLCARDRPDAVYLGMHPIDDSAAVIL